MGNKNNSKIVAPRFIWGIKKHSAPKRFPFPPFPAPEGAGKGGKFVRYIIIYAVLNPTPKGVGYDLNVHFTYFRNPKFIAPVLAGE